MTKRLIGRLFSHRASGLLLPAALLFTGMLSARPTYAEGIGTDHGGTEDVEEIAEQMDGDPILEETQQFEFFGSVLAAGDFNGDGREDLAIGVPAEDKPDPFYFAGYGAVHVIYGANGGLNGNGNQLFKLGENLPQIPASSFFLSLGYSLVAGDFDGDRFDDLAVHVPGADISKAGQKYGGRGATFVLYGTPDGLSTTGLQYWHLESPGVPGSVSQLPPPPDVDDFSAAGMAPEASGDFNRDGYDDLAFGLPSMIVGGKDNAGAALVIYGSDAGLHVSKARKPWLVTKNTAGIMGVAGENEYFGSDMQAGDFDGDGDDDLAIGSRSWIEIVSDGECNPADGEKRLITHVIEGSKTGLNGKGDYLLYAQTPDCRYPRKAAGDFDGDGDDDLIAAIEGEPAMLFTGQPSGLNPLFQNLDCDESRRKYECGSRPAAGDVNNDGKADLAIGYPFYYDPGEVDIPALANTTSVLYAADPDQLDIWSQASPGILGTKDLPYGGESFGAALVFGDFNGDGYDDLAIGVPDDSEAGDPYSGAVNVIYGSQFGLNANGDQLWTQDS